MTPLPINPEPDEDADLARRAVEADGVVVAALRCAERCAELHAGLVRLAEAYRDLHARTCDDYWDDDECACGGRQLLAAVAKIVEVSA